MQPISPLLIRRVFFFVQRLDPYCRYDILPRGLTAASYWLVRLPFIGESYVRPRILAKSSKL